MAEGGDVSGRKPKEETDSVDVCNLPCCVCIKKSIRTEAVKYCLNCLDYYCGDCDKLHDFVPALSGHVVVGKEDIKRQITGGNVPSIPTKRCPKHETKIVDMYCKTHNEVGCTTCFAMEHSGSSCIKLYVPESLPDLFKSDEIQQAERNLSAIITELRDALVSRDKCKSQLLKLKKEASEIMESYTNELLAIVLNFEKETTGALEKLIQEVDGILNKQNTEIKTCLSTAEDVQKEATRANSDSNNESQQYICSILAETTIRNSKGLIETLQCPAIESVTFTPHLSCKELFQPLLQQNTFGTFSFVKPSESKIPVCSPYNVESKRSINTRVADDKKKCFIYGSCTFPDGSILLTDRNNHCLKRVLPHQSSMSDHLDLPTGYKTPWTVCVISEHEAAVTLPSTQQVQFVSIGETMEKTRTMKLDYWCRGITCYNGELYLSDWDTTVYVYTTAGKLLRQFSKDKSGDRLFSDIRNITVSESGRVLYVADGNTGLIAVDTQTGYKVWQYTADDLKNASGVCVDGRGSVFVCGWGSHNVLQISESGEKIADILSRNNGISSPWSVCFDKDKRYLVVTGMSNEMLLFTVKNDK